MTPRFRPNFSTGHMKSSKLGALASINRINATNHAERWRLSPCLKPIQHRNTWGTELPEHNPGNPLWITRRAAKRLHYKRMLRINIQQTGLNNFG